MAVFVLANIAAARIITQTGNMLIIASILPLEFFVLWFFLNPGWSIKISWPRLILVTIAANLASSIIAVPFGFNDFFASSPGTAFFALPFFFLSSVILEWIFYLSFIHKGYSRISKRKLLIAAILANLASYILFIFFLQPFIYSAKGLSASNPKLAYSDTKIALWEIISYQKESYYQTSQFASKFNDLKSYKMAPEWGKAPGDNQAENQFHRFKIAVDPVKTSVTASAKEQTLKSYTAVVFLLQNKPTPKLIEGICESDRPSMVPPEIPQLMDSEIKCAPGSSLLPYFR